MPARPAQPPERRPDHPVKIVNRDVVAVAGVARGRRGADGRERRMQRCVGRAHPQEVFQHLNRNRLVFITESVVGDVLGQLTTGASALTMDKFDPLITAAGESVALAPKDRYLALLTRVALNPSITSQDVGTEDAPLVRDLFAREVLERDASGRLRIRVGLFAEWLRANSVGNAE